MEIRVGLSTAAGLDERPGEIPGLGPVGADVARAAVAAQLRGAGWKFAVVDSNGRLLLAGPVRSRPRVGSGPARVRGGVVELHLTVEELHRLPAESVMGDWHGVLAEIGARWAGREQLQRRLAANPRARFARCPLAEHVRIRDRTCCGPGCTRAARRSDLDHTWEHARGGETVHDNIGTGCKRHHPDKDRGWSLSQPEPGHFRWVSPLGRTYRTRGEPVRPDLPDLHPAPHAGEDTPAGQRPGHFGQRNLRYPATAPPRPPPSRPDPSPPPF